MNRIIFLIALTTGGLVTDGLQSTLIHSAQATHGNEAARHSGIQVDLSGEWFDQNGKRWTVSQKETEVVLVNEEAKVRYQGTLKDRVIRYTSYITLRTSKQKECMDFVGSRFEYEAQLILSKDGNRMEMKAPDMVSKGKCKISLKKIAPFILSRTNLKQPA